MASEPKKPIEQMLEALAKARRAQFGDNPKMPNPMRSRLHEEIARAGVAEDDKVEPRASWLTMFWPRVTVAAALATLIVLVPAIWWNRSHPGGELGDVAVRDRLAGAGAAEGIVAKPLGVSASEPSVNLADNSQIKVQPAATPSSEAEALKSATKGFTDKEIAAAKIQAAPAAAPADDADSKAKSETMAGVAPPIAQPSSADLGTKQQFSQQSAFQSFRSNAQVNQAANVLNTFQVQQQGDEIRVVDADGSTYIGKIQQLPKGAELDSRIPSRHLVAKQTRTDAPQAAGETESAASQSYFRATGYNVSLKKKVVFEGSYAAPAAQLPAKTTSNDKQRTESSRNQVRIVGTVRVNGEPPVEVDAIAETAEPAATKKSEK